MKKVIKKSLIIVVMFATMVSYANGFTTTTELNKDYITNLTLNNVTQGSVLTIKDVNGLVLYKEVIKQEGTYSKEFDLTALPDGNYIFELDKTFEIKVIPFQVNFNQVFFHKEKESIVFKPTIINKGNLVKIHYANLIKSPLYLKIYYENGDLVYTEKIAIKKVLEKGYDFSTSVKGYYTIVISNGERRFEEKIKI